MGGTRVRREFVPDYDATVVARLKGAGAVLLGKLNLTEGAMAGYHRDFNFGLQTQPSNVSVCLLPTKSSATSGRRLLRAECDWKKMARPARGARRLPR